MTIDVRDAFFNEVYDIASRDRNVVFMTADADALSLHRYKHDMPDQFINVGVAEQNMVDVAAGLALCGKKVFIYAIIPFVTMRCYEHIKATICGMNLPVTIVGAGAGLTFGYDGPTHHAVQDIAVMRTLPEMAILNPCDDVSATACARMAYGSTTPVYVRIDKGAFPSRYDKTDDFNGGLKVFREIREVNIIATGFMSQRAVEIADELEKYSVDAGVIDLYRIKPVNETLLLKLIGQSKHLITVEENSIIGGIGTIISELLGDHKRNIPLKRIALQNRQHFDYGGREWLHEHYGLDVNGMVRVILKALKDA